MTTTAAPAAPAAARKKYTVQQFVTGEQVQADLNWNGLNLDETIMRHAGLFAYYGEIAAKAQEQFDKFQQLEGIINARLDQKIRDKAVKDGVKLTEAQVKARVILEPEYIAIQTAVNEARKVAAVCKTNAESFRQRRDMIVQGAFNTREEKKGELRIMEEREQRSREIRHARTEAFRDRMST
jgi:hypothetical protein